MWKNRMITIWIIKDKHGAEIAFIDTPEEDQSVFRITRI